MTHRDMTSQDAETIISASVKVEGDFVSQGNVLIEGAVEGSLKTERDLRVGEKARIAANVTAANAVVAGEVQGNMTIAERLELEPSARVQGDVTTKILVVASGATINGKITMVLEAGAERPRAAKAAAPRMEEEKEEPKAEEKEEEKEMAMAGGDESAAPSKRTINAFFR